MTDPANRSANESSPLRNRLPARPQAPAESAPGTPRVPPQPTAALGSDFEPRLSERETQAESKHQAKTETQMEFPVLPARPRPVALRGAGENARRASLTPAKPTGEGVPAAAPEEAADKNLLGPYRLLNCIESGKSCQVWEAHAADGEQRLAVKLMLPEALKSAERRRAMRNEFRIGQRFDHPGIIRYYAAHWGSFFRPEAYFSMELFLAPSLKSEIQYHLQNVQSRLRVIVESAAAAFAHIHERGYLHRDIKPANLLVNGKGAVRVIGFSLAARPTNPIARLLGSRFRTTQGTRSYMAPEQILKQPLTCRVDIYSFGVVLFEMLTGRLPFVGSTPNDLLMKHLQAAPPHPSHFNDRVSPRLDRVVLKMLAKKPDQRYRDFTEFLEEFTAMELYRGSGR